MTTIAKPWSNFSHLWADLNRRFASLRESAPAQARHLYQTESHWLWVVLPLTVIAIYVYVLNWTVWFGSDHILLFQPFVLIGAGAAIYMQRDEVAEEYAELAFIYPDDSPKRRGKPWLVVAGCLILLTAAFSALSTLAIAGLVVTLVGCIYLLYGPFTTRTLWRPLLFLFLMIPPPVSYMENISGHFQSGTAVVAGQLIHLFIHDTQTFGPLITLPGFLLEVTPECGGLAILLPVLALTFLFAMFRRLTVNVAAIIVIIATVVALSVNVLRVVAIGLLSSLNPDLARAWHDGTPILVVFFAYYLTHVATNAVLWPQRRLSEFEQDLILSTQIAEEAYPKTSDEGARDGS